MVPHIKDLVEGSVSLYTEFPKWLMDQVQIREEEIRADERVKRHNRAVDLCINEVGPTTAAHCKLEYLKLADPQPVKRLEAQPVEPSEGERG